MTISAKDADADRMSDLGVEGMVFAVCGFPLMIPFGMGVLLPARPWAWTMGMVLICLGLTSVCTIPACIPLLIFWLRPETKAFFGKLAPGR